MKICQSLFSRHRQTGDTKQGAIIVTRLVVSPWDTQKELINQLTPGNGKNDWLHVVHLIFPPTN